MGEYLDIDQELGRLIIQYKIDRYHPRFAKGRKARQLMREFFESYRDKEIFLVAASSTDANYIKEDCGFRNKMRGGVIYYSEIENYLWNRVENAAIIVVSFYGRWEAMSLLDNIGVTAVSLYDYFTEKGLFLEGNYYDIFGGEYHTYMEGKSSFDYIDLDMNSIFFYDRRNYEIAGKEKLREMYLARMIFDCVYIKDWVLVKKYIEEYVKNHFSFFYEYKKFYLKVEGLLDDIKQALMARNQDDIIIFWLDALEFGEDRDMPFLHSLSDASIDFVNAYTVTPYTKPTIKTMFMNKCTVDDKAYNLDISGESPFFSMIEKQGFCFRFYTFEQMQDSLRGRLYHNEYTPFTEICWDMIHDMLRSEEKIFAVCHEFLHTHPSFVSYGLSGKEYVYVKEAPRILSKHEIKVREEQILESRKYTDNVLRMYSALLPGNVYKIYMSDHGHTELDRFHAIFRIVQKNIIPKKIEGIFSYSNFSRLIFKMIQNETDYSDIIETAARIQDVDYYNKSYIQIYFQRLLKNRSLSLDWCFGYKGVITHQYTYIRYNDGRERYYRNNFCEKPVMEADMNDLRMLCTEYPQDIIREEKFKYSRNVYATINNYWNRKGEWERKTIQEIAALFDEMPDGKNVAIRGGGRHTWELWFVLKQKQQEKIKYIIDADKQCMAARLGFRVIDSKDIVQNEIDIIIISSFKYESEWAEELKKSLANVSVIGLYDYLKKQGIECNMEFYKKEYIEADIVWEE